MFLDVALEVNLVPFLYLLQSSVPDLLVHFVSYLIECFMASVNWGSKFHDFKLVFLHQILNLNQVFLLDFVDWLFIVAT